MKVARIKPPTSTGTLGLDMMVLVEPLGLTGLAGGPFHTVLPARLPLEEAA